MTKIIVTPEKLEDEFVDRCATFTIGDGATCSEAVQAFVDAMLFEAYPEELIKKCFAEYLEIDYNKLQEIQEKYPTEE